MRVGSSVAVDYPHQPSGIGNHHVRVLVPLEEWRQLLHPVAHLAADHHAAVGGEIVIQQYVGFGFTDRRCQPDRKRVDGKSAFALIARCLVLLALGVVEFRLGGVDEHRLVRHFAIVDFRPGKLQALGLHFRGSVLNHQHRQAVLRHLADFRQHQAVAVRINEGRVDPVVARIRQVADIQFARRQQYLAVLSVDHIAVHIAVVEHIVSAQRLPLRDSVVKCLVVPQPHVVQQRLVRGGIDHAIRLGLGLELLDALLQPVRAARGVYVRLNVRPLQSNLVGADVQRRNRARHHKRHHQRQRHTRRQNPPARQQQPGSGKAGHNQQPLQRQSDVEIHVVHAYQEGAVLVVHHFVAAQEKAHRQRHQQDHRRAAQKVRFQPAFQLEDRRVDLACLLDVRQLET